MHYASLEDQELEINNKNSQEQHQTHPLQQQIQQQSQQMQQHLQQSQQNNPLQQQIQQQNQQQIQQQNQRQTNGLVSTNENSSGQYLPSLMQGIDSLPKETVYLRSKIPSNPHLPMMQIKPYQE